MKKHLVVLLAAVGAMLAISCDHNEYQLVLIARDNSMVRQLTVFRTSAPPTGSSMPAQPTTAQMEMAASAIEKSGEVPTTIPSATAELKPFPADVLAKIAKAYPNPPVVQDDGLTHVFLGEFQGKMPDDIGGSGHYTPIRSSLGAGFVYMERFRGNDDLMAAEQMRIQSADRVTDLLIGWLESELGREKDFAALKTFLNGPFRKDMRNVSLYFQTTTVASAEYSLLNDVFPRLGLYFMDRGYLQSTDLAGLYALGHLGDTDPMPPFVTRQIVLHMNLPENSPKLAFLGSVGAMKKSLGAYLARTPEYQKMLAAQKQAAASCPPASQSTVPDALDVISEEMSGMTVSSSNPGGDMLSVSLATPVEPFWTNGLWDPMGGKLIWQRPLPDADHRNLAMPVMCYASWSAPDVDYQQQHIGDLLVDGQDLFNYCVWRDTLSADDGKAWDKMIDGSDNASIGKRLAEFQFPSEKKAKAVTPSAYLHFGPDMLTKKVKVAPQPPIAY